MSLHLPSTGIKQDPDYTLFSGDSYSVQVTDTYPHISIVTYFLASTATRSATVRYYTLSGTLQMLLLIVDVNNGTISSKAGTDMSFTVNAGQRVKVICITE